MKQSALRFCRYVPVPWKKKRGRKAEIESRILTEVLAGVFPYARSRSMHEVAHRHIHSVDI